ncbi:hypothetical protein RQP46_010765 [Phenoliferia psychrophenolica]
MPSLVFALASALVAVLFSAHVQAESPIISMYWPAYSSAIQPPSAIPWSQASIMNYFVTVTTATGMQVPDGQTTSDIKSFVSLAKSNNVRPVVSLGGWDGGLFFSSLVSTAASRKILAGDLSSFATKWGFEGVDIDWEYPNTQGIGCNNISTADSANLLHFVKELRRQLESSKIITAAVSMTGFVGPDGEVLSDFSEYAKYIDYLNIMSYDVTGTWSGSTGPNSPLNVCNSDAGADTAIEVWTGGGFPAHQILLGVPAYGYAFMTLSSKLSTTMIGNYTSKIYQAMSTTLPKGDSSDNYTTSTDVCGVTTTGYLGNWEMNELISEGLLSSNEKTGKRGFTRYWDDCTSTPFLFNPATKTFITYDDSESIGFKAAFAVKKGLAGLFVVDSIGFTSNVYASMRKGLGLAGTSSTSSHHSTSTIHHHTSKVTHPTTSTSTTGTSHPSSTTHTSSCSSGELSLKCLTSTTFALCDGSTCTEKSGVEAGTKCVGGKIVASIKAHVARKERH